MAIVRSIRDILTKLNYILTRDEKWKGFLVLILTFVEAVTELLGVTVLVPLIQAFVDISKITGNEMVQKVIVVLGIKDDKTFVVFLFALVGAVFVFKNILALVTKYVAARFSCKVIRGLSTRMMKAYMEREYVFFTNTNVSEIYRGLNTDAVRVYEMLNTGIQLIKSSLIILVLFVYLLYTSWWMTVGIIFTSGLFMVLVRNGFKKIVKESGEKNREYASKAVKNVLEAFAGIKEIIVLNRQQYFVDAYQETYKGMQKTQIRKTMAESSPVHILESVLVCVIMGIMAYAYTSMDDLAAFVPTLAIFVYSCSRIMPLLGGIAGLTNAISFQYISLNAVYNEFKKLETFGRRECLNVSEETNAGVAFEGKIEFQHLYWTYGSEESYVLKDLNLTIRKGESVAFIGKSGAGKSTLVDIILGLFVPQSGTFRIDGVDVSESKLGWSKLVGYVPQANYLLDDTIRHNIAFGIADSEIDDEKIWRAIEKAQLTEYINSLPEGLETAVGERGVRLSGGQRQRIVIARALYNEPAILILDEATSALDGETEAAVVSALEKLRGELTLIVVAHRLSTIKDCDHIYEITDGQAVERNKEEIIG